jgi:hypothetical protein
MNLTKLSDKDLHSETKALVGQERQVLTMILYHLKEMERRRLFSDFGCSSLFDYAVKRLTRQNKTCSLATGWWKMCAM